MASQPTGSGCSSLGDPGGLLHRIGSSAAPPTTHGFAKTLSPGALSELIALARVKRAATCRPDRQVTSKQCDVSERLCRRCSTFKSPDSFHRRSTGNGFQFYCKTCQTAVNSNYYQTLRGKAQAMVSNARARSKQRGHACTITYEDIIDMVLAQCGRCYYSGVPMELQMAHSHWTMSLERLDNDHGYTVGNCVLVASEFNTPDQSRNKAVWPVSGTAQWSREKVQEVTKLRSSAAYILDLSQLISVVRGGCRRPRSREQREPNHHGWWLCAQCQVYKPAELFKRALCARTGLTNLCTECSRWNCAEYRRTLRGNASSLVGRARARAKIRGQLCTLTLDDIITMLGSQNARCYYSGISMEFLQPNSHWRMSLERLDNDGGYSRDNCVLIVAEFNTADYSRNRTSLRSPVHGTAQWSCEKVDYVWGPLHSALL